MSKNVYHHSLPNFLLFFILLTNLSSFIDCVIEIPIKIIKTNPNQKYKNITLKTKSTIEDYDRPSDYIKIFSETADYEINDNLLFLAEIKIGSNSQSFKLVLDTGSSIVWVAGPKSLDSVEIKHHYYPSTSTTSKNTTNKFNQVYGSGSCSGFIFTDTINYVNNSPFQMKFGVTSTTNFDVEEADGIIGLGKNYEDSEKSLIMSLYKNKIISSRSFSFKFTRVYYGEKATFYIGKHEDFSKSETTFCSLLSSSDYEVLLWACKMNSMSLVNNGISLDVSGSYTVIFDSGTNVIIMPIYYIYKIKDDVYKFGCSIYQSKDSKNSYQLKCSFSDSLPVFQFKIDNNIYKIPNEFCYYKLGGYYYSRVVFQESNVYIFGSPFFFTFHTLFNHDEERIYFYPEDVANLTKGSWFTPGTIVLILILILLIILLIYLIVRYIKWMKWKRENEEINKINNISGNYFV